MQRGKKRTVEVEVGKKVEERNHGTPVL